MTKEKHINLNILIIASSDMDGSPDNHNIPEMVINAKLPCSKFVKMDMDMEKDMVKDIDKEMHNKISKNIIIPSSNSPRCTKCEYTEIEHKYGYPIWILPSLWDSIDPKKDKDLTTKPHYSDLWRNRFDLFDVINKMFNFNNDRYLTVNYHTCNPMYINNKEYLPMINKLNDIVAGNLGIKGGIHYMKPYNFNCYLEKIQTHKDYKQTLYDMIFIVSGAVGELYTPRNMNIMSSLLRKKYTNGIIANFDSKPASIFTGETPAFNDQFRVINPINYIFQSRGGYGVLEREIITKTIKNYTKILLGRKFVEINEFLFLKKNTDDNKKTRKNIK